MKDLNAGRKLFDELVAVDLTVAEDRDRLGVWKWDDLEPEDQEALDRVAKIMMGYARFELQEERRAIAA